MTGRMQKNAIPRPTFGVAAPATQSTFELSGIAHRRDLLPFNLDPHFVFAGELLVGVVALHGDGQLQHAGAFGCAAVLAANLEDLAALANLAHQGAASDLVRHVPAVVLCAFGSA